ncbi:hypothetical protein AB3A76_001602 [Vibrio alginolyticus]|nr:hypothetical protein [Vibrio alginolyticus]
MAQKRQTTEKTVLVIDSDGSKHVAVKELPVRNGQRSNLRRRHSRGLRYAMFGKSLREATEIKDEQFDVNVVKD